MTIWNWMTMMRKRYQIERKKDRHVFNVVDKNDYKHKNIKRLQGPTHYNSGFQVSFLRSGVWHTKTFLDKDYGSVDGAFLAAISERKRMETRLGKPRGRWEPDYVPVKPKSKVHFVFSKCDGKEKSSDRTKITCKTCFDRIVYLIEHGLNPDKKESWK